MPEGPSNTSDKRFWVKGFAVIAAALIGGMAGVPPGYSNILHRIRFEVKPIVLVWRAEAPSEVTPGAPNPPQSVYLAPTDIASIDLLGSGTLVPADPSLDPGEISVNTASPYFHVASNTAFQITARIEGGSPAAISALSEAHLILSVELSSDAGPSFGSSAQWPHSGGPQAGLLTQSIRLSDLTTARTVFRGDRKTAARPGTVASQSVRFSASIKTETDGQLDPKAYDGLEIAFSAHAL